jgi:DNA-binding LytR/AlgR family response regulator
VLRLARTLRGELIPLRLDAATRFEAAGDYVEAHVGGERLLLRMSLGDLEQELDGRRFWRVHRSHLVAADAVKSVREHDERRLIVVLADGTEIVASRAASRRLRELIA